MILDAEQTDFEIRLFLALSYARAVIKNFMKSVESAARLYFKEG